MKREHQDSSYGGGGGGGSGYAAGMGKGKKAMMEEAEAKVKEEVEEMDELLAALGYKVRSSDMADVAQKLEQLDMAMAMVGSCAVPDDGFLLSQLHLPPSDVVHYNPSDLSSWLDSMLSELNTPPPPLPPPPPPPEPVAIPTPTPTPAPSYFDLPSAAEYDLKPIPAPEVTRDRKRMRIGGAAASPSSSSSSSPSSASSLGGGGRGAAAAAAEAAAAAVPVVVVVDAQEAGIRLVHALLACAEAVQRESLAAADALLKEISVLAGSQGGAMRKVAAYFAEALARRVYNLRPPCLGPDPSSSSLFSDLLYAHFYEASPYLKFAHFTANQAILEAFAGCRRVHVVDLGIKQGLQWPALLQALALRPGGAPSFCLTAVAPPNGSDADAAAAALQEVGWKLARFADAVRVDFRYRPLVVASLADLDPSALQKPAAAFACEEQQQEQEEAAAAAEAEADEEEAVAVNSVLELHQLLARPGAAEKVLGTVRALRPRVFTVVEQEANHNAGSFLDRFTEALHYYSTVFDSLEGCGGSGPGEPGASELAMAEAYVGREIGNVVGCDGAERTERHETLEQWKGRMGRAGFEPVPIGSNAFKQASTLLALFGGGGGGFRVEERDGCLTLGWHTRPLIATSAWRVAAA